MNRFLTSKQHEAAMTSFYGGEDWRQAVPLPPAQRQPFLHELFKQQLEKVAGLEHVRSFEIVTAGGATGYHLFYGTNDLTGLWQMKKAMWKVDPLAGQRFRDSTDPNQPVLFELEVDTTPLARMLRAHFGTRPFSIEQAERFTLIETPYIPEHIKTRTLKPLEQAGDLEPVDPPPKRKRWTYPPRTRIRFTR